MKRFTERQYEEPIGAEREVYPAQQAAGKRSTVVILSGQGEILRCAQDDSEGLRMTARQR